MFDKKEFKRLIELAMGERNTTEYANDAGISRAYISKLLNERLERPPSPDVIKGLVKYARNGVTYEQLMIASGHISEGINIAEPSHISEEDEEIIEMLARTKTKEQKQMLKKIIKSILDEE